MPALTIAMACYDDFEGVYFTVQGLRTGHGKLSDRLEFIVIDNNPESDEGRAVRDFVRWVPGSAYVPYGAWQGSAIRTLAFELASSPIVMCVDSHVVLEAGALDRLLDFYSRRPNCPDLIQGPMLYDNLVGLATHMEPIWREHMWGVWATDSRGFDPAHEPFEIPMHGLGVFVCRREAWLGFNGRFRGFGGEEGYIHEKFRQAGRRTLCLPSLRWTHRFRRPRGVPFGLSLHDRIRNYVIGHNELGLELTPIIEHFSVYLDASLLEEIVREAANSREAPTMPPISRSAVEWQPPLGGRSVRGAEQGRWIVPSEIDRRRCKHFGAETGETRSCPACAGHVELKLFECAKHGACTSAREVADVRCCHNCDDFAEAG